MKMLRWGILVLLVVNQANAFIPPVTQLVRDVFEGRKPARAIETVFKHRVSFKGGEVVEIEERVTSAGGKHFFLWRSGGNSAVGTLEGKTYALPYQKSRPVRSNLFLRYYASQSPDEFRDTMLGEGFLRRDQLIQYKPSFDPKGDPRTWDVTGNYIKQDDVFLSRAGGKVGIVVTGSEGKSLLFEKDGKGILQIEWKEPTGISSWAFEQIGPIKGEGVFPQVAVFTSETGDRIQSELLVRRTPTAKQINDFQTAWRQVSREARLSSGNETALQLLLSYR